LAIPLNGVHKEDAASEEGEEAVEQQVETLENEVVVLLLGRNRKLTLHRFERHNCGGRSEGELSRSLLEKIMDGQVQKLLSLIEAPKDNHEKLSGKCDWLLDSEASYRMIGT